ncbi:hypothetical protein O6H91_02G098100 [Diphasiastrum complanatum]|nr:hypothetical protein O6H91_02G098100 [Diphasiastrum complanatum]
MKRRNRDILYDITSSLSSGPIPTVNATLKKLRRMPHVFPRVLELPFNADAPVEIYENEVSYKFAMLYPGLIAQNIRTHVIEIVPGAVKLVVEGIQGLRGTLEQREAYSWRFRLPASTIPEASVALYERNILIVIVPKRTS